MKVLVVGNGGREHALAWKLSQSPQVKKLFCAPGNPGMAQLAELADIPAESVDQLAQFAGSKKIDLTVVGPEAPLVGGIVDRFQKEGLTIFGPDQKAARLESSKAFAKQFLHRYHIPTASYEIFTDFQAASVFIRRANFPLVIKASGLAAGKGAVIANNREEAEETLKQIMVEKIFGKSGEEVVIEDYLEGEELSLMAFCDGQTMVPMKIAQDHKRLLDGDEGPNTGGMGTYAPVPFVSQNELKEFQEKILEPTRQGLHKEGIDYRGVLYAGLMLTRSGPKVLEFNCRFGDPETQAVLPLLETDLVEICRAVAERRLLKVPLQWKPKFATCIVLASAGYPGAYEKGKEIRGLNEICDREELVFQAGTKSVNGRIVTSGGRVLGVTASGESLEKSIDKAYRLVDRIHFEGMHFRSDIGRRGVLKSHA
ncbi:MAG: phosphoribosylamine--glycine ligase [candidate division Zixibacteria bacterium RBG_16_48_11]|nr:MAG: phosphoribosylamine--glycine ligase [candidate division Zixibacteria bacterium RBG_16_48_11]